MDFAYLVYKVNYNKTHQPLFLEINNLVLLHLDKGYEISTMEEIITKMT